MKNRGRTAFFLTFVHFFNLCGIGINDFLSLVTKSVCPSRYGAFWDIHIYALVITTLNICSLSSLSHFKFLEYCVIFIIIIIILIIIFLLSG